MARLSSSDISCGYSSLSLFVARNSSHPSLAWGEELFVYGGVGKGLLVHVESGTAEALTAFGLCESVPQICIPTLGFLHDIENQLMLVRHDELRVRCFRV